ncbi:MAG: YitT family protein [Mediterraneibacter gnavus]
MRSILKEIKLSSVLLLLLGSAILAFGLYNIHSMSNVTEGGILGLTLLLEYWFGISPSVSGFVLTILCYFLGWKLLGKRFLIYSFYFFYWIFCFYRIFEQFDSLFPNIGENHFWQAVVGALFVGISVGLCVRVGGAPTGDDALAMSLERVFPLDIQWIYLISDLVVLLISLTYIPVSRITYSLLTVVLSGQIIGLMQKIRFPEYVESIEALEDER